MLPVFGLLMEHSGRGKFSNSTVTGNKARKGQRVGEIGGGRIQKEIHLGWMS